MAIVFNNLSAGGGSKLYRHRISFLANYNSKSIPCYLLIENHYENPYDTTTILDYMANTNIPVVCEQEQNNNEIYSCVYLSSSDGTLRGKIDGLRISLNEDNSISIKGISSFGQISNFTDTVTEL